jgi:hypothetical protein
LSAWFRFCAFKPDMTVGLRELSEGGGVEK